MTENDSMQHAHVVLDIVYIDQICEYSLSVIVNITQYVLLSDLDVRSSCRNE